MNGKLILGVDDDEVNVNKPIIKSTGIGLKSNSGSDFNIYDGRIEGLEGKSIDKTIGSIVIPDGYIMRTYKDGENYNFPILEGNETIILVKEGLKAVHLESKDQDYDTLEEALQASANTDKITILDSVTLDEGLTIDSNKDLTLDLSGYSITSNAQPVINNEGTLKIIGKGQIKTNSTEENSCAINNVGTLTLGENDQNMPIVDTFRITGGDYGVINASGGVFNFYDGMIKGSEGKSISGTVQNIANNCILINYKNGDNYNYQIDEGQEITIVGPLARLESNDSHYNSIKSALAASANTDKITLLNRNVLAETLEIAQTKNIVLDLSGYSLITDAQSVINNAGDLKIVGNGEIKTSATGENSCVINNTGTLALDLSDYSIITDAQSAINNAGNLTIIGEGEIKTNATDEGSCAINNTGTLTLGEDDENVPSIEYPKITGGEYGIKNSEGILNFYDGIITGAEGKSIYGVVSNVPTDYIIGTYKKGENYNLEIAEGKEVTIIKGKAVAYIQSKDSNYVSLESAIEDSENGDKVILLNAIKLDESLSIASDKNLVLDLAGYMISGTTEDAVISNAGNLTIVGNGEIKATATGENSCAINNTGTLTLGEDEGRRPDIKDLKITGRSYGVINSEEGIFNFYDGIITGAEGKSISGTVTNMAEGSMEVKYKNNENQDFNVEEGKEITILKFIPVAHVSSTNKDYDTLQEAIDACEDSDTITMMHDAIIREAVQINSDKNITLELAGYTIKGIVKKHVMDNAGTLTIKGEGKIVGEITYEVGKAEVIYSTGTLNIINGAEIDLAEVVGTSNARAIKNEASNGGPGNFKIDGGVVKSVCGGINIEYGGKGEIINTEIECKDAAVYAYSYGSNNVSITGSTITCDESGVYCYGEGLITINNCSITADYGIYNYNKANITIDETTIDATTTGIYNRYSGIVTILSGTITSENSAIVNYNGASKGTIILGNDDDNVNTESPKIIGGTYGIENSGYIYFYDGIITGNTQAIKGNVLRKPSGYNVSYTDDNKTAKLVSTASTYASTNTMLMSAPLMTTSALGNSAPLMATSVSTNSAPLMLASLSENRELNVLREPTISKSTEEEWSNDSVDVTVETDIIPVLNLYSVSGDTYLEKELSGVITRQNEQSTLEATQVTVGDIITYKVKVTNPLQTKLQNITIAGTIPEGIELVEVLSSGQRLNQDITWTIEELLAGESKEIELFKGKVEHSTDKANITSTVTVAGVETDELIYEYVTPVATLESTINNVVSANKEDSNGIQVLTKEDGVVTYDITYNVSIKDYKGKATVEIVDTLPAGIDRTKSILSDGVYNAELHTITWTEEINDIDTFTDGEYTKEISKQIAVVYVGQNVNADLANTVVGTINIDDADGKIVSATAVLKQEYIATLKVVKDWDDNNNAKGKRPDSVSIDIAKSNSAEVKTVVLSNANNWTYEETDLAKYDTNGNEITYTVTERETTVGDLEYYNNAVITPNKQQTDALTNYTFTVANAYKLLEADLKTEVTVTSNKTEITGKDEQIKYTIRLTSEISDYIGEGKITLVDTLPYKIDLTKSNIAGGVYDDDKQTITWEETLPHINTEVAGTKYDINRTKEITVVYKDMDLTKEKLVNIVNAKVELYETEEKDQDASNVETAINVQGKVIVKYLEKGTEKELAQKYEIVNKVGAAYSAQEKEITDYICVETTNDTIGTITEDEKIVIYYYEKQEGIEASVVVKYQDKDGNKLADDTTITGFVGKNYKTEGKDIANYKLVETKGKTEGKMAKDQIEVIYVYEKIPTAVVVRYLQIVNVKDENGAVTTKEVEVEEAQIIIGYMGDEYEVARKPIKSFKAVDPEPQNAKGVMTKDTIEVKYYYERVASGVVTVKYLDVDTQKELTYQAKNENGEVEEKSYSYEITGKAGEEYEAEIKGIPYYKVIKVAENAKGELTESDDTVIYYYKKLDFNIAIENTISKISLSGRELEIKDNKLAKVEIPSKEIESAELLVTYKVIVTNKGEVKGKATVVEEIPKGYEIIQPQAQWKLTPDGVLETEVELNAGESKVLEVTLKWINNESNLGTKANITKIQSTENLANYVDTNKEDDASMATVIVGIKTGWIVSFMIIVLIVGSFGICGYVIVATVRRKGPEITKIRFLH